MKKLRIIDLFCGTGGFSKGFINGSSAICDVILGIDLLQRSCETFQLNHPGALSLSGDIRKLRRQELSNQLKLKKGQVDLIVGGPPCQGFSSIRPFRSSNEDDPRNTLFEEFASFVNFFRPKAFVLENVVGLATHQDGATLSALHDCFAQLGYECDWRVLNSAHFGVPQKRERLIYIGVEKGSRIVFPKPTHYCDGATIGLKDRRKMILPTEPDLFEQNELMHAVSVDDAIADLPPLNAGQQAESYDRPAMTEYQRARRRNNPNLTWHCATAHSTRMLNIIKHSGKNISCIPKHLISSGFSSCYSRLDADLPSVTITVNFVHPASNRCIHPQQHRALTPREGARLQSFDDSFVFAGNRSEVAKQIGNAVPPLLGTAIARTLLPQLLN